MGSDGAAGQPAAIAAHFPQAQQQRCVEHKVRWLDKYPSYTALERRKRTKCTPLVDEEARRQQRQQLFSESHF